MQFLALFSDITKIANFWGKNHGSAGLCHVIYIFLIFSTLGKVWSLWDVCNRFYVGGLLAPHLRATPKRFTLNRVKCLYNFCRILHYHQME